MKTHPQKSLRAGIVLLLPVFVGLLWGCESSDPTQKYQLTTQSEPAEAGTVIPSSGEFEEGSMVEIEAEPSDKRQFVGWEGDLTGTANPDTLEMTGNAQVTAIFEWGSPLSDPDCIDLDPENIEIEQNGDLYQIVDGNSLLLSFSSFDHAKKARDVIQYFGLTEYCFVGRPNPPFVYWLVDGAPPEKDANVPFDQDCLEYDPDNMEIQQDGEKWIVVESNSILLSFDDYDNAQKSLEVIQYYGFTQHCFVGRPDPGMSYWLR